MGKITSLYKLRDVAACRRAACVFCAVQGETERDRDVCCVQCRVRLSETEIVLCAVQSETERDRDVCCVQCRVRLRETEMCVVCSAE